MGMNQLLEIIADYSNQERMILIMHHNSQAPSSTSFPAAPTNSSGVTSAKEGLSMRAFINQADLTKAQLDIFVRNSKTSLFAPEYFVELKETLACCRFQIVEKPKFKFWFTSTGFFERLRDYPAGGDDNFGRDYFTVGVTWMMSKLFLIPNKALIELKSDFLEDTTPGSYGSVAFKADLVWYAVPQWMVETLTIYQKKIRKQTVTSSTFFVTVTGKKVTNLTQTRKYVESRLIDDCFPDAEVDLIIKSKCDSVQDPVSSAFAKLTQIVKVFKEKAREEAGYPSWYYLMFFLDAYMLDEKGPYSVLK